MNTYTHANVSRIHFTHKTLISTTAFFRIFFAFNFLVIITLQAGNAVAQSSSTLPEGMQALNADSLFFNDEYEFRDFCRYHGLKDYDIKPQVDFYDCTINPGTQIYTDQHDDDFLHEERFEGKPLVFIVDHNGTRKIYNILIPSLGDTTITTCDVDLYTTNPVTGQVAGFKDIYNWIDENGKNIFNMNKKIYFLWGFTDDNRDFPTDMIQTTTGIDFTFPNYFPEDAEAITLIFKDIEMYNQNRYYPDADGDGFGSPLMDTLSYDPIPGFVTDNTDCDDINAGINPSGIEVCNTLDDNCDGITDDGTTNTYYADNDNDGFGDITVAIAACAAPTGYVSDNTDCDDNNNERNSSVSEVCNMLDDNCNGIIDEGVTYSATLIADGPSTLCKPEKVTLLAYPVINTYTYTWRKNGNILPSENPNTTVMEFSSSGTYSVEISSPGGCISQSEEINVTVSNKPKATIMNLEGTNNLCDSTSIMLRSAIMSFTNTYQWLKDDVEILGATDVVYNATEPGVYNLFVTNSAGCGRLSADLAIINNCRVGEVSNNNILVYPNPTSGELYLEADMYADAAIIADAVGNVLLRRTLNGVEIVDMEAFADGLYIIHFMLGETLVQSEKVILMR
jgi:hypothetical protein